MSAPWKVQAYLTRNGYRWQVIDRRKPGEERVFLVKTWGTALMMIRDLEQSYRGLLHPWIAEQWVHCQGYWGKVTW